MRVVSPALARRGSTNKNRRVRIMPHLCRQQTEAHARSRPRLREGANLTLQQRPEHFPLQASRQFKSVTRLQQDEFQRLGYPFTVRLHLTDNDEIFRAEAVLDV